MTSISRTLNKVKDLFATPVPRGMTEFKTWSQSIIDTYNPPMSSRDVRFTLAALLMRLDQAEAKKPKRFFADALSRGAAAQVGAYVMEQIKEEQKKEWEAVQAKAAEDAAKEAEEKNKTDAFFLVGGSNVPVQN